MELDPYTPWLCPNFTVGQNYTLAGDPIFNGAGSNFAFKVSLCEYAETISDAEKLNCEQDEQTILDYLNDLTVGYKSVH
jgi:hypothetical protein